jgi:putative oxidoreductase
VGERHSFDAHAQLSSATLAKWLVAVEDDVSLKVEGRSLMRQTSFFAGRILLGGYLLLGAFHHFSGLSTMAGFAAAHGVPMPEASVAIAGVFLAVAGLSFLLGLYPTIGVAALVVFLVPVTLTMHAFWADRDSMMRQMDLINFSKNVGLLGAGLMFLAIPRPWAYSVEQHMHLPIRARAV